MRAALLIIPFLLATPSRGEEACPKYANCVPLDHFECRTITDDSCVNRVCYDSAKRYMIIWLGRQNTAYPYCEVAPAVVAVLEGAQSVCGYYNSSFRSKPDGTHGPFDCRDHPMPTYP